jgi:hypothetical protein
MGTSVAAAGALSAALRKAAIKIALNGAKARVVMASPQYAIRRSLLSARRSSADLT